MDASAPADAAHAPVSDDLQACERSSPTPGSTSGFGNAALGAGLLVEHHLVHLHRGSGTAPAGRRHFVQRSIDPPQVVLCLTEDQVRSAIALAIDQQHHPRDGVNRFLKRSALPAAANGVANARGELVPVAVATLEPRDPYVHAALSSPSRSAQSRHTIGRRSSVDLANPEACGPKAARCLPCEPATAPARRFGGNPPPASRWLRCRRHSPEPTIASTVRAGFPPATASATKRSPDRPRRTSSARPSRSTSARAARRRMWLLRAERGSGLWARDGCPDQRRPSDRPIGVDRRGRRRGGCVLRYLVVAVKWIV